MSYYTQSMLVHSYIRVITFYSYEPGWFSYKATAGSLLTGRSICGWTNRATARKRKKQMRKRLLFECPGS